MIHQIAIEEGNSIGFISRVLKAPLIWLQYFAYVGYLLPDEVKVTIWEKHSDGIEKLVNITSQDLDNFFKKQWKNYHDNTSLIPNNLGVLYFEDLIPMILYESLFGMNTWFKKNIEESFTSEIFLGHPDFSHVVFKYDHKNCKAFAKLRRYTKLLDMKGKYNRIWLTVTLMRVDTALVNKSDVFRESPSLLNLSINHITKNQKLFKHALKILPKFVCKQLRHVWFLHRRFKFAYP